MLKLLIPFGAFSAGSFILACGGYGDWFRDATAKPSADAVQAPVAAVVHNPTLATSVPQTRELTAAESRQARALVETQLAFPVRQIQEVSERLLFSRAGPRPDEVATVAQPVVTFRIDESATVGADEAAISVAGTLVIDRHARETVTLPIRLDLAERSVVVQSAADTWATASEWRAAGADIPNSIRLPR